eukprot:Nk52_evm4s237 gene=Nk52_evmTU4s237
MRSLTRLLLGCFMLMMLCGMLHLCNCMEPSKEQVEGDLHKEEVSFKVLGEESNSKDPKDSEGNYCLISIKSDVRIHNSNAPFNPPKHRVIHPKVQDIIPEGFCAGITKAIGLHLLFNYKGQDAKTFANGYSKIVTAIYKTGHLFHLWEIQNDAGVLVKSIAIEITKNNLPLLLNLKEGIEKEQLLAALPDLFPTYSINANDKLFNAEQFSLDVKKIFEEISPDYPFAFIPVSYHHYNVNLQGFKQEHLTTKPPDCNDKNNPNVDFVCFNGSHETAFIVTPHFMIYHDSNRFHHEAWTFDSKKDISKAYSSIEETIRKHVLYDGLATLDKMDHECLKNGHGTIATCVTYLQNDHDKYVSHKKARIFKIGPGINIESVKTQLQNQAKFNKYLTEKYRGSLTDDVFKKVIEDHLIETVEPPLQTLIEALSPAGVRDTERLMWSARELLKTPPEPKFVRTVYCLATGGLHNIPDNINELKKGRGLVEFERSVLTFDLLMLRFSVPYEMDMRNRPENLCNDYRKHQSGPESRYGRNEKYLIESICTSDGQLKDIYRDNVFLNPDKADVLATRQVTAELRRYHKCFKEIVNEETPLRDFEAFEGFLRTQVIPVIYEYGYTTYLSVKSVKSFLKATHNPKGLSPNAYYSKISNTVELMKSDSIKAFLGQSLFFTYAVPKLLTFLPPGDTLDKTPSAKQNLISNLQCAHDRLLDKLHTLEECQNTRDSGLRIQGNYLNVYMEFIKKDNVNLFTFLYYMLENCGYVSQKEKVKQQTLDGFKSIGFPQNEVGDYVNLFVTSFKYYKHSAIFSKDNICCKVISKIEDGHQYLYALVRLIALHREFQKVAFDCPDTGLPAFLKLDQLCYFPSQPPKSP